MQRAPTRLAQRLDARHHHKKLQAYTPQAVIVLALALCGVMLVIHSRAAAFTAPQEAEAGQLHGNAAIVNDTGGKASGGSFVTFSNGNTDTTSTQGSAH